MILTVDPVVRRHAVLMLLVIAAALLAGRPELLTIGGVLVFALRIFSQRTAWWAGGFGLPNYVTVFRLLLTASLGLLPRDSVAAVTPLAMVIFALDGLDGWLARRLRRSSEFGAALDMEVDAYFVAMLCACLLWRTDVAGWWIALPAVLRYLYVLTVMVIGREAEAPRSRLTRYSFSILVCSLSAGALPFPRFATFSVVLGAVTVCSSFAWSFWALFAGPRPVRG